MKAEKPVARSPAQTKISVALRRLLPSRLVAPALFLLAGGQSRLLSTYGYSRSLKSRQPLDQNGAPLPWLTYGLISFLDERLRPDLSIIEFGGGFSTLYFMRRVGQVVTIEHDHGWLRELQSRVGKNVRLVPAEGESPADYCAYLNGDPSKYDIALIDGIHRNYCFDQVFSSLSPEGVIIFDDTERDHYAASEGVAKEHGYKHLHFEGHKPGSIGLHRSTIYYRASNCLGI